MKSPYHGIRRILNAFVYSAAGFSAAFKSEAAFRQDLAVFVIGTGIALWLPVSFIERVCLISPLLLILLMELANTAIETVVDRISDDFHLLSKKAKDIGSLLVLIAFINAILWWAAVLCPLFI